MKETLRKWIHQLAALPLLGRLVRIAMAVYRLPDFRAISLAAWQSQHEKIMQLERERSAFDEVLKNIQANQEDLARSIQYFSHLVEAISDQDKENLVKSAPVALRKLTREQYGQEQMITTLQDQVGRHSQTLDYLLGRVEFVRRELMFEQRYGASSPDGKSGKLLASTEIRSVEKLAAARATQLKINLGCGHIPLDGYLNVDRRALPGVDIVAEVDALPLTREEVDEIFSSHLLEHFPQEQLCRELLPHWFNLLKPGGILRAVVPDSEAMLREYAKGEYPYDNMREVMFGAQDYDGDFHFNMFTPESLIRLLQAAGYCDINLLASGRRNGLCFEFEIAARKPGQ